MSLLRVKVLGLGLAALLVLVAPIASAQTKLLRFPDIHGDKVVFSYAGDLWLASSSGGTATRLTAHPGLELFAKFSPDGQWIAFTGQYDGDEQVYVMPTAGGVPKQLTYYPARGPLARGYDHRVYGWTRDGKRVLFGSWRDSWKGALSQIHTVAVEGGLPEPLPMPSSGAGDFSPDGRRIVYSPGGRDFRPWKRYQGGQAQDLYIFDLATFEAEQITDHPRNDRDPMWVGDKIYFSTDHDGTLNLYVYDISSQETHQLTHSTQWDVRWPSADEQGQIAYQLGGELEVFDVGSGEARRLTIHVPDDGLSRRPSRISAENLIEDWELSPDGEHALFVARGDIFTVSIENGSTRNLTNSSNAHDKWARWSPDGSQIAFVSDRSGEEEIHLVNPDGSGEPEQLTTGGRGRRFAPEWARDGKRLAFSDMGGRLFVLTLEDKTLVEMAAAPYGGTNRVRDYTWSPNGGHLAFSLAGSNNLRSLYIWSVSDGQRRRITGEMFHEFSPAWDPEGHYLYYLSDREFAFQVNAGGVVPSRFGPSYVVNRQTGMFALALRKDVKHPFPPGGGDVTAEEQEPGEEKRDYIQIDFDDLAERVARVSVPADNYSELKATNEHLFYIRQGAIFRGRASGQPPALQVFSIKDRTVAILAEQVALQRFGVQNAYALSQDGSKALVRHQTGFKLYAASPRGKGSARSVSTKNLMMDHVPPQEWAQIFDEVWRLYRERFYAENMHGYDWEALRDRYRPLVAHVAHRVDLNYVMEEMVAELNSSHAYVSRGDYEIPERPNVALPGARFRLDPASGRYRIAKIFRGHNEEERYRSPLTEIGVAVREGDYLLAIDGQELLGTDNPYRLLRHKGDRPVQLTVSDKPTTEGARQVSFRPITTERNLVYLDWVTGNREKVAAMTDGRVGYLHFPGGADSAWEFHKYFCGQIRKEGLIVDGRANGGGSHRMFIERLRRVSDSVGFTRTGRMSPTEFHGHMVCLVDENAGSGGDGFPYMFREAGLGPVIGKRTLGGTGGWRTFGPLIDGGVGGVPFRSAINMEGNWNIEGHGVDPDIEVENTPRSLIEGHDLQLERAVEEVMKLIRANPKKLPTRPPDPIKTK